MLDNVIWDILSDERNFLRFSIQKMFFFALLMMFAENLSDTVNYILAAVNLVTPLLFCKYRGINNTRNEIWRMILGDLAAMVEGHLASTNAADGTKDWENFMATIGNMQSQNNFSSSYSRGEESIAISRLGNSNTVQIRYTNFAKTQVSHLQVPVQHIHTEKIRKIKIFV